jgi:GTPase
MSTPRPTAGAARRRDSHPVVALIGNPNTGKSSIFNALTGLRQHTGNWPGKTVTRAEGRVVVAGHRFRLVDLPGVYSLHTNGTEEEVARDFLLFDAPDATVVVVDATALERNLALVVQVMEVTSRLVVALNLVDEARRRGIRVDTARLADELGVPVVATAAPRGEGLPALLTATGDVALGRRRLRPRLLHYPAAVEEAIGALLPDIERQAPGLPSARWVAISLLLGDARIADALADGRLAAAAAREAAAATREAGRAPQPAPAAQPAEEAAR